MDATYDPEMAGVLSHAQGLERYQNTASPPNLGRYAGQSLVCEKSPLTEILRIGAPK